MGRWISFDGYGPFSDWQGGTTAALKIVARGCGKDIFRHNRRIDGEIEAAPSFLTMRRSPARSNAWRRRGERSSYVKRRWLAPKLSSTGGTFGRGKKE